MTSNPGSKLVTTLFNAWEKENINFVVLRNYKELPDCIGNDIDILVCNETLPFAEKILRSVSKKLGFRLQNRAEFSPVCLFVIHSSTGYQVHFDLFTSLQWRSFEILAAEEVLRNHSMFQGMPIPHPVHEAMINLLTKLLFHGNIKDKYKTFIAQTFKEDKEKAMDILTSLFDENISKRLVNSVLEGDWDSIEERKNILRKTLVLNQLGTRPIFILKKVLFDIKRLVKRWYNYPGVFIVCMGPDGSGKTSVADRIIKRFKTFFNAEKTNHYHWKPILKRHSNARIGSIDKPHRQTTRGSLSSTMYLFYHAFEFVLGGVLCLRPMLFRNGMIIVDRYFYDIMVDPKRYRLNVSNWLVHLLSKIIVKPDLIICLDAPAKTFYERKQEVPFEEVIRQRKAYLSLVKGFPNGHIVNSSLLLDDAVKQLEEIIVNYMVERTEQQWQLKN